MSLFIKNLENIHRGLRDVKHILLEEANSKYLIVSFSWYNNENPSYAYGFVLDSVKSNKLFLIDTHGYENKGCWFLGENLNFDFETSVIELIKTVQYKLNVPNENVITVGSSMGGWAALYYALKYDFGSVIVGGAQVILGNYLNDYVLHRPILNGIVGEITREKVIYMNNLILNQIVPNDRLNCFLHYGLGDVHLEKHCKPFYEKAKDKIHNLYLDIQIYRNHSEIINFYQKLLRETAKSIIEGTPITMQKVGYDETLNNVYRELCDRTTVVQNHGGDVTIEIPLLLDSTRFAIYLLNSRSEPLHKAMYQKENRFTISGIDLKKVHSMKLYFQNSIGEIKSQIKILTGVGGGS